MAQRSSDEKTGALPARTACDDPLVQDTAGPASRLRAYRRAVAREEALRRIVAEDRELLDRLAR